MTTKFKKAVIAGAIASPFAFGMTPNAHADQHQCQETKKVGYQNVAVYYDQRIELARAVIADIQSHGGDPNKFALNIDGKFFTFPQILQTFEQDRVRGFSETDRGVNDCEQGLKPAQDVMNAFMNIATGGLSALAPGKMLHMDVSDIIAGYTFGGPDALIPKLREDAFRTLGIGGDVAAVIRDPVNALKNFLHF